MSTWILIGDSQGVGLSVPLTERLTARGYERVGQVVNVGWSTPRTAASGDVQRLPEADLAVVVLGGNDTPGPQLPGKIALLLQQIRARRIVWIGPAHSSRADIDATKQAVARIQASTAPGNYTWLDGRPMTGDLEHAPDDLHFVASARRIWAERIAAALSAAHTAPTAGTFVSVMLATVGGALLGFSAVYFIRSTS